MINKNKCPCGKDHGTIEPYESVLKRVIVNYKNIRQFKNLS